jgi:hypothetical protein
MRTIIAAGVVAAVIAATSATAATIVTSATIKDGTIQTVDISAKAKRALKGNRGPQGPAGQDGFDGSPGPPGIQRLRLISNSVSVPPGTTSPALAATCAPGETAVSGGFIFPGIVIGSSPAGQSWLAKGFNDLNVPLDLYVYAYCSGGITTAVTGALPSASMRAATAAVSRTR